MGCHLFPITTETLMPVDILIWLCDQLAAEFDNYIRQSEFRNAFI